MSVISIRAKNHVGKHYTMDNKTTLANKNKVSPILLQVTLALHEIALLKSNCGLLFYEWVIELAFRYFLINRAILCSGKVIWS